MTDISKCDYCEKQTPTIVYKIPKGDSYILVRCCKTCFCMLMIYLDS